ncbi:MAG TPA: HypC/HybG/HupF family hydrogenase formation chaperone [Solirubrobacteraceae bacterium]
MAGPSQRSRLDNPSVFDGHDSASLVSLRPPDEDRSLCPADPPTHQFPGWLVTRVTELHNPAQSSDRTPDVCLAIPGQIIEIVDDLNRLAKVDVAGVRRNVNVGLLDAENDGEGVGPGDWVLIHVGFAISKVDEEEARATRDLLVRMGADYEQELEELKASVIE